MVKAEFLGSKHHASCTIMQKSTLDLIGLNCTCIQLSDVQSFVLISHVSSMVASNATLIISAIVTILPR